METSASLSISEVDAWDDEAIINAFEHAMLLQNNASSPSLQNESMPLISEKQPTDAHRQPPSQTATNTTGQPSLEWTPVETSEKHPAVKAQYPPPATSQTLHHQNVLPSRTEMPRGLPAATTPVFEGVPPTHCAPPPAMNFGVTDEALSDMLLAWYYSGYYTGRYQATQEFRQSQQHQQQTSTAGATPPVPQRPL